MAFAGDLTFHSTSIREVLSGAIAIMTPYDLPLIATLEIEETGSTHFEWLMDELATPTATTSRGEGVNASFGTLAARQRAGNVAAIVTNTVEVSDSERHANEAGIEDEFSFKIWKQMIKTLKEMEFNFHWGDTGTALDGFGGANNTRQTHGVFSWLYGTGFDSNAVVIAGHSIDNAFSAAFFDAAETSLTGVNLSRDNFHDSVLAPFWRNGGTVKASIMFCGAKVKRQIGTFALVYDGGGTSNTVFSLNERNIGAREHTLVDTIDVFDTDYGPIAMNLDRYMDGDATITYNPAETIADDDIVVDVDQALMIIEPRFFKQVYFRGLSFVPLAKLGDSTTGQVVMEAGIKVCNPLAGAVAIDAVTDPFVPD